VHHVAAGHDQYALLAKRIEFRPEFQVIVQRLIGIDTELDDRDGGVRKSVHQHRPGAMIDAPAVHVGADPGRMDAITDLGRELSPK